jgi:hypothetical protein
LVKEENPENWAAVDAWAANVYGLGGLELQTIDDTLRFNMPFAEYQNAAQIPPTESEVIDFCAALKNDLGPWAVREGRAIEVYPKTLPVGTPWAVARVCTADKSRGDCALATDNWPEVLQIADSLAASEVIYPVQDSNCVWIARLNQARYWSRSQARLVARKIVWEQLETLLGSDTE